MDEEKIVKKLKNSPTNVTYQELYQFCTQIFGNPLGKSKGSHVVFRTPWQGDPRINIQAGRDGKAKPYQIKQVLRAYDKIKGDHDV